MTTTETRTDDVDIEVDAGALVGHGRRRRGGWPLSVRSTAILAAILLLTAGGTAVRFSAINTSREAAAAAAASTAAAETQAQREAEQKATEQAADLLQTQSNGKAYSVEAANLSAAATGMVDPAILAALDSARTSLDEAIAGADRDPITATMSDVWNREADVVTQLLSHADLTRQNSPYAPADTVTTLNTARDALASALEQHGQVDGGNIVDAARAVVDGINRTDSANNDGHLASIAAADAAAQTSSDTSDSSDSDSSSSAATGGSSSGTSAGGTTSSSTGGGTTGTSIGGSPAAALSSSSGSSDIGTGDSQSDSGTGSSAPTAPAPAPSFTTADADAAIAGVYGGNAYPGDCDPINSGTFTAGSVIRATSSLIGAGGTVGWSVSVTGGTASVQYYACY
ncbi:hypothetical protein [Rathayibacter rathayi]|nr:hypothetical protein [Rathayibacter rathayi]